MLVEEVVVSVTAPAYKRGSLKNEKIPINSQKNLNFTAIDSVRMERYINTDSWHPEAMIFNIIFE